jgi:dolichol-phosphate mannosyltransferase
MSRQAEQLSRVYGRRFSEADRHAKDAVWKTLVEGFFQRWIGADEVVLDLGCGFGEFLNHLRCGRKIGVDANGECASLVAADVEFHAADVCDLSFLADGQADTVFTSNLMEHLSDKPAVERMLKEAWRVLKMGGQFIALGPNLRYLPGAYWDFWDHVVPITGRSLVEALELAGFSIRQCVARFLPYTTCSRLPRSQALVRLYLKLPPLWRLFGRQFLVRARKVES